MINRNRDLLLLMKATSFGPTGAFEKHVEELHKVLLQVEGTEAFCTAHELATRTALPVKNGKIIRAIASRRN
jgi:hypothetical protein